MRLLSLLLLAIAMPAAAATFSARVVGVLDGDTIDVLDATNTQHRIRLMGIDAPEKAQPFGQSSKKSLSDLVYGKTVNIEWEHLDIYGKRIIGKVLAPVANCPQCAPTDANLQQVESGMAWWYADFQREQSPVDRVLYGTAMQKARAAEVGLWSQPNPTPPWQWRKHPGQ